MLLIVQTVSSGLELRPLYVAPPAFAMVSPKEGSDEEGNRGIDIFLFI